jgi:hypothetical protein
MAKSKTKRTISDILNESLDKIKARSSSTYVNRSAKVSEFIQSIDNNDKWNYVKDVFGKLNPRSFAGLQKFLANPDVAKTMVSSDQPISLQQEDITTPIYGYVNPQENPNRIAIDTNMQLPSQYLQTILHEAGHLQNWNTTNPLSYALGDKEELAENYMRKLLLTLLGKKK